MKPLLISCIVPFHNGERYLREALDSILAQTYRPIEIIVVDDGCADETGQLVASYGDGVRYFWQPNAGPPRARNVGLGLAQGEFVAFLDADDLWQPDKLSHPDGSFSRTPGARPLCHVLLGVLDTRPSRRGSTISRPSPLSTVAGLCNANAARSARSL